MIRPDEVVLILAEDDEDDYLLLSSAFRSAGLTQRLIWVRNGEELMDLLHGRGKGSSAICGREFLIVLLDLNMPRMDGREVLRHMKEDQALRRIPVVVLTTSRAAEDVRLAYQLGVNSYLCKPMSATELVRIAATFKEYWLNLAELPSAVPSL